MENKINTNWTRKELKKRARHSIKKNYLFTIIVCIIMALVISAYPFIYTQLDTQIDPTGEVKEDLAARIPTSSQNTDTVNDIVSQFFSEGENSGLAEFFDFGKGEHSNGALSSIVNNSNQSGSMVFGVLNAINQTFFQDQVQAGVILFFGAFLLLLYILFVDPLFVVGEKRFFLESRNYHSTPISRLFFLLKIRRLKNPVFVLALKNLFLVLWYLTVVGGIIKSYSYKMIPYILAENPDIHWKDAFALSKVMMRGNKWKAFKLDVIFVLWYFLSIFTLGFLNVFYINPYVSATNVELYITLRESAIKNAIPGSDKFVDIYLTAESDSTLYPANKFHIEEKPNQLFDYNYNKSYSMVNLVFMFFTFSLIGWLWEVVLELLSTGEFVNRGVLLGPWLPIYGSGGILLLLALKKWRDKPLLTFILSIVLCGIVEYGTGWYLETYKNAKWWDYTGYMFNLHGRICLEGLVFFGLGGLMFIYFLAPILDHYLNKIPKQLRVSICIILGTLFVMDFWNSHENPNTGDGISTDDLSKLPDNTD